MPSISVEKAIPALLEHRISLTQNISEMATNNSGKLRYAADLRLEPDTTFFGGTGDFLLSRGAVTAENLYSLNPLATAVLNDQEADNYHKPAAQYLSP